ncbi:hypothetical protein GCM10027446_30900 [Angustibacter peucedani]
MRGRRLAAAARSAGTVLAGTVLAGTVLAGALLAGCGGGLPDSGPAGEGRDVGEASGEPLQAVPEGPRPGAQPAEIVGGFLHAGAGFEDDHAVARTFLSGGAASSWRPAQRTLVYPDDTSLTVTASGSGTRRAVVVRAPVWGTIDEAGQLVLAAPGTTASSSFSVTQVGEVWRIDEIASGFGLWMPRYEFERAYTALRLAFVADGTRSLVPDLRWYAGARAGLATFLVRELLRGPPVALRGAVSTGAPDGTTLSVDAVPVSSGVAQVDLSSTALSASPEQRQQLWAQLSSTLRQLSSVSGIRVTVAGAPYAVAGVDGPGSSNDLGYSDDVKVAGPVLVLSGDRLLQVDASTGQLVSQRTGRFAAALDVTDLRSVSAGPQSDLLVGVERSGRRLVQVAEAAPRQQLARGLDLAPPVVDRAGWAWTSDRAVVDGLLVAPATSSAAAVAGTKQAALALHVPWLAGRRVLAVDVSRDGARVAVVSVGDDGGRRLDVAGIIRGDGGRPSALAAPRGVGQSLAGVHDVSWADRTNLAVLAGRPGSLQPYQVEVGGLVTALPTVGDASSIWAGDGLRAVYLATTSGQVLVRSGNGWRPLGPGGSVTIPQ